MLKTLMQLSLVAAVVAAQAEVRFVARSGKEQVGSGSYDRKLQKGGSLLTTFKLSLTRGSQTVKATSTDLVSRQANPLKSIVWRSTGLGVQTTSIQYNGRTASVTETMNGRKTNSKIRAPRGVNLADTSVFWFVKYQPPVGRRVSFYSFDPSTKKWERRQTTYMGPTSIMWKGRNTRAYLVRTSEGLLYLDSNGWPLRVELDLKRAPLVLERQ